MTQGVSCLRWCQNGMTAILLVDYCLVGSWFRADSSLLWNSGSASRVEVRIRSSSSTPRGVGAQIALDSGNRFGAAS